MTETTETAPASDAGASGARKGGLNAMLLPELKQLAGGLGIKATGMRKGALIEAIKTAQGGGQNSKRDSDGGGSKKADTAPGLQPSGPRRAQALAADEEVERPVRQQQDGRGDAQRPAGQRPAGRRGPAGRTSDKGADKGPDKGRRQEQGHRQPEQQPQPEPGRRQPREPQRQPGQRQPGQRQPGRRQPGNDNRGGDNRNEDSRNAGTRAAANRNQNQGGNRTDEEDGGSRRNRRRRGRDRDRGRANQGGGGGQGNRGTRNEPDMQVLEDDVLAPCAGILDLMDNYAFVRTSGYLPGSDDVYVSMSMVRKFGMRRGDAITGQVRQPREGERQREVQPARQARHRQRGRPRGVQEAGGVQQADAAVPLGATAARDHLHQPDRPRHRHRRRRSARASAA